MTTGSIWTESDLEADDTWYMHGGRDAAGHHDRVGPGRSDAHLLARRRSHQQVRGRTQVPPPRLRARLARRACPKRGRDALQYDIHIDGHAQHGDVRLFFFHYDCNVERRVQASPCAAGQAGFFTEEELDDSKPACSGTPEEAG